MYPDSEILFPARCIPELRNVRPGDSWRALIDRISNLPETHDEVLAFSLMMIQLSNCLTCDLDSYRASLGCCQCARRTIQSFKGNDKELLAKLEEARQDLFAARVAATRPADTAPTQPDTKGRRSNSHGRNQQS
ncbi:MAG: hypothetical protein RMN25_03650 [Anaerolineae bacterium]|nr:hypothetical protein [Thermoflexales bacterium]MDW8406855.1 hypothetical protein [Anaerolineae bacterium]